MWGRPRVCNLTTGYWWGVPASHPHIPQSSERLPGCQPSLQTIYVSVSEPYTQLHLVGGRCRSSYVTSFLSFAEMARISLERRLSTTNSSSISWRLTMQWPEQSNRLFEKCDCEFLPMKHIGHACVHDGRQAGWLKGKSNFGSYNSPPHPSSKVRHLFNTIAPML